MTKKHRKRALPHGCGTLIQRDRFWWMYYADEHGVRHQESTKTEDWAEARRILAREALQIGRRRLAELEAIADEAPEDHHDRETGHGPGHRRMGELLRDATGNRARAARRTARPRKTKGRRAQ
jgi:hypothetical protein